jgi:bifunctional non-homologous end joining protein LigD
VRTRSYRERYRLLLDLICERDQEPIGLAPVFTTAKEKAGLLRDLKELRREGIVFKRLDAPYTPGRPNSGGSQYKFKFTATLSAVVAKINPQRSVELRLIGKLGWQPAGNVTIPANQSIPQVGEVVEVRYLYAFQQSGVLYQPVYLGRRTDIDPAECMVIQLKYQADDKEES